MSNITKDQLFLILENLAKDIDNNDPDSNLRQVKCILYTLLGSLKVENHLSELSRICYHFAIEKRSEIEDKIKGKTKDYNFKLSS